MNELKIWYKIEKFEGVWTVWKYKEGQHSYGSLGIFSSPNKQACLDYCKKNKITLGKNKRIFKK